MRNILIIMLLGVSSIYAENINIGLYTKSATKSFIFTPELGSYVVYTDKGKVATIEHHHWLKVIYADGRIYIRTAQKDYGEVEYLHCVGKDVQNTFRLKLIVPSYKKTRVYHDNLLVSIHDYLSELRLINNIELDRYLSGVLASEVGTRQNVGYYRVQSIICRTYAIRNMNKHRGDGYNLCDRTHCQAYTRHTFQPKVLKGIDDTKGIIIVDAEIVPISATFSSNCGGQSANSEDVWGKRLEYLRSVRDTNCIHSLNARWKKTLPFLSWKQFLIKKHSKFRTLKYNSQFSYFQQEREAYMVIDGVRIKHTDVRKYFKLKSAFYSISSYNGKIVLTGVGFGHGVGMCQEGAMDMAKKGRSYISILHHYYKDVYLINQKYLDFFRLGF